MWSFRIDASGRRNSPHVVTFQLTPRIAFADAASLSAVPPRDFANSRSSGSTTSNPSAGGTVPLLRLPGLVEVVVPLGCRWRRRGSRRRLLVGLVLSGEAVLRRVGRRVRRRRQEAVDHR